MKFSTVATILIVAIAAILALFQHGRITELRADNTKLVTRAVALGIPVETDGSPSGKSDAGNAGPSGFASRTGGGGATGSSAARHRAEAKTFANELFAMMRKMKEIREGGGRLALDAEREAMAFFQRFLDLDPAVMPHLIQEIRDRQDITDDEKREILAVSFMSLAQNSPESALNLYIDSKDLITDKGSGEKMLEMALAGWASKDPAAVLAWLETNGADLPSDVRSVGRRGAIANVFRTDPGLAIDMTLKLPGEESWKIAEGISSFVREPAEQLELLRTLDAKLGESTAGSNGAENPGQLLRLGLLNVVGSTLARQSFSAASEFIASANLSVADHEQLAHGMVETMHAVKEPGVWLPWIYENLPAEKRDNNVTTVVRNWTLKDFQSTADWIGTQPAGALRDQSTRAFAETVAPQEPASAAEWALTLPPSEQRTELLLKIRDHWQSKDEAAAAAFAIEHGLTGGGDAPPAGEARP